MGDQISLKVYYTDYIHKNLHFKPRWKLGLTFVRRYMLNVSKVNCLVYLKQNH